MLIKKEVSNPEAVPQGFFVPMSGKLAGAASNQSGVTHDR